jgi:phenylalanyl-tRNA synthetase beta chain
MKLPISLLREWVAVEGAPAAIADALTRAGFYVGGITTHGGSYPGVIVARVLEVARHPNADRLSLCRVDGGAGELRVVCGAPNVRAGMIAPLATVGARLLDGTIIKKSKIRGEESQGMLCSARELGLSDDHEGIVDLERMMSGEGAGNGAGALPIGRPLDELLGPPEVVLDVEVPFNRPDGLGIVGLAREVRAALGGRWTDTARERLKAHPAKRDDFDLELEDSEGCPRYLAQVIEGVAVAPSPRWLRRRLEALEQRSINTIVDLTNLVLFEFGQPLHAFDLARIRGPAIRVRRARAGERMTTLDGRERTLNPEVLVIADRERPVALAGIMGGAESEVTAGSTSLLLECAWFDPRRVRRGARSLDLATEASKRYERGVDPEVGPAATARFLSLLKELSPGARVTRGRDRRAQPASGSVVALRPQRIARLLGVELGAGEVSRHLESLEFGVRGREPLQISVPSWRPDVTIEDDLVEEVARAWGYDRIPEAPLETHGVHAVRSARERQLERARRAMLSRGLSEAWTSSLITEREALATAALTGEREPALIRLVNPMSREGEVMRPNPVAGLLRACGHNLRQGTGAVRLFEIGAGFNAPPTADRPGQDQALPDEPLMLAAIVCGGRYAQARDADQRAMDFEDAKGLWEAWLEEMRVDTPEWRGYAAPGWKPGASAEVVSGTSRIGWAGSLGQELLRGWDIEVDVHLFLVLLDGLSPDATHRPRVALPRRFPPVRRDLAFFVPERTSHDELARTLRNAAGEWLVGLDLFDVYVGPGTPPGMKSLAFALQFQHPERTLAESEIQDVQDRMTAAAAEACGARLRER